MASELYFYLNLFFISSRSCIIFLAQSERYAPANDAMAPHRLGMLKFPFATLPYTVKTRSAAPAKMNTASAAGRNEP